MNRKHTVLTFAVMLLLAGIVAGEARAQSGPYDYYAITPCRVADTRSSSYNSGSYLNGTPTLPSDPTGSLTRAFFVKGQCGVPGTAKAVTVNATVVNPTLGGWLALWPAGISWSGISTLNFTAGAGATANGAIVPLSTCAPPCGDLNVRYGAAASNSLDFVLDVTGYFQ